MSSDDDKIWDDAAGKLRKAKGLCPPSAEEAEADFDEAPDVPLSDEQISSIVDAVTSGKIATWEPVPEGDWEDDPAVAEVGEQSLVLYRNQGEDDPVNEQIEKELEEELLSDDEHQEDET